MKQLIQSLVVAIMSLSAYELIEQDLMELFALETQAPAHRVALHSAQQKVRASAKRFNVVDCGRRWGKTVLDCDLLMETALQGWPAGYFVPEYKYLTESWREIVELAGDMIAHNSNAEHRMELKTGGVIEGWSLNTEGNSASAARKTYKGGRSRKYKRAVIDEAALVKNLEGVFDFGIRASLIDLEGDAWFTSTPNGKGAFYRVYRRAGSDPDWISWQMPTHANPTLKRRELERIDKDFREGRMLESVYRQEYLAEFIEDGGVVFRNVTECARPIAEIWREQAEPYHVYVISWDLAKKADFSVMTVIDCTTKTVVKIDRFNRVEYMVQIPRLVALAEEFQPTEIVVESNGNFALLELLAQTKYRKLGPMPQYINGRHEGFSKEEIALAEAAARRLGVMDTHPAPLPITEFVATNASKEEAVQALVLAFERGEITIPEYQALLEELENFGCERLPSGAMRYSAPEGEHDDCVMSLSEGWYRARRYMSEEALPIAERARRMLPAPLRPEAIAARGGDPYAEITAAYLTKAYVKELINEKRHFMRKYRD